MMYFKSQEALRSARFGLMACVNLEREFLGRGDAEAAAFYRLRQRHWQREILKLEGAK